MKKLIKPIGKKYMALAPDGSSLGLFFNKIEAVQAAQREIDAYRLARKDYLKHSALDDLLKQDQI